jgi:hypothetical protein
MTGADTRAEKKRTAMSDRPEPIRRLGERRIAMSTTLNLRADDPMVDKPYLAISIPSDRPVAQQHGAVLEWLGLEKLQLNILGKGTEERAATP